MPEKRVCYVLVFFVLFCAIGLTGYHFRKEAKQFYNEHFQGNATESTQSGETTTPSSTTIKGQVQALQVQPGQPMRSRPTDIARKDAKALRKRRRFLVN